MPEEAIGKITAIEYTDGPPGNQWTTIEGKRYATFWTFKDIDWRLGDTVVFEIYKESLDPDLMPVAAARNIRRLKENTQ